MQDPEIYLGELGITVQDFFEPGRPARMDTFHRSRVNYETYFFADQAGKARFDADPIAHAGVVTDPVSRQRFRPAPSSPRVLHDGRPYVFFSEETRSAFVGMPEMYADPDYKMLPGAIPEESAAPDAPASPG